MHLQHRRQIGTPRTTWIVHVTCNLLRAGCSNFVEPINKLRIAATIFNQAIEMIDTGTLGFRADHAHDIALFEVGETAAPPLKDEVGLSHVAWRMATLDDLAEMYRKLQVYAGPKHPHEAQKPVELTIGR